MAANRSRRRPKNCGEVTGCVRSPGLAPGYTNGMKTAISLPDDVYREAERHAKRTRKSRSQLYAEALAEYLARHAPDEVTERMNQVLAELGEPGIDPFLDGAGRRVLKDVEW